jgi:hypothetical protein
MSKFKDRVFALSAVAVLVAVLAAGIATLLSNSFVGLASATNTGSVNIVAQVTVNAVCEVSLSPGSLTFPAMSPGVGSPTQTSVTDNNIGNGAGYIWIYGSGWTQTTGGTNTFAVGDTVWNYNSVGSWSGTALTGSSVNTAILVAGGTGANGNVINFGVNVPIGQPAATYAQNIVILNAC